VIKHGMKFLFRHVRIGIKHLKSIKAKERCSKQLVDEIRWLKCYPLTLRTKLSTRRVVSIGWKLLTFGTP
jgi:hypothetical protein